MKYGSVGSGEGGSGGEPSSTLTAGSSHGGAYRGGDGAGDVGVPGEIRIILVVRETYDKNQSS